MTMNKALLALAMGFALAACSNSQQAADSAAEATEAAGEAQEAANNTAATGCSPVACTKPRPMHDCSAPSITLGCNTYPASDLTLSGSLSRPSTSPSPTYSSANPRYAAPYWIPTSLNLS